jgi:hypothetical protein
MPNWCANTVKISTKVPSQEVYIQELIDNHEKLFNFIKPCPEKLFNTISGFSSDGDEQKQIEDDHKVNLEKFGYKNWYDFCLYEWGTRGDVHNIAIVDQDKDFVVFEFDTAWSPPIAIYEYLCNEKDLDVLATYAEQGCAYIGYFNNCEDIVEDFVQEFDEYGETIKDNFIEFFESHGFGDLTPPHYGG